METSAKPEMEVLVLNMLGQLQHVFTCVLHWGLRFRLKNGAWFLLEAVEKGGNLVGRMQNNDIVCESLEQIPLGLHELDYGDIANAYGEMSKPEKYNVVKNNCQEWIVQLCNLMKISMPEKLCTFRELLSLPSDTKKKA